MLKSSIFVSLLTVILLFTVAERSSVATAGSFDWAALVEIDQDAATETFETPDSGTAKSTQQKRGNGFARALGAPFRALGRLFGGGKKNDQQARRMSDKDVAKFEATKIVRIKDSTIQPPAANNTSQPASPAAATPSEFAARLQNGRELLLAGNVDAAINELTTAAKVNPKSAEVHNLLGIAYETRGLRDRALESFELAVRANESNAEHLNNLGFLLYKNGDYERATKYLKKAAKLSPKDARVWNNLALTQCERQKFDDAYASFSKAVGEYGAHLNMATQLQSKGYAKDAIKHLEQAQAVRPNSVEALTKLVALYELTGRPTDAENARRSLVALKTFADAKQ